MTTSANVTKYIIRKNGEVVGNHHENALCHYHYHELLEYEPREEFTIQAFWNDEDEVTHEYEEKSLTEFLKFYYDKGKHYRSGFTIEEIYNAPKNEWGFPDIEALKKRAKTE